MYLEKIDAPQDLRGLTTEQLHALADEIREALLRKLSVHGGHIGPNLGMVEATIALHRVFDSPKDKIIYDVSHQSYVHKMLTGRRKAFLDPADYDEVSGYTNPQESEHDHFTIGHTSTSVSLACGLAKARDLRGRQRERDRRDRRRLAERRRSLRRTEQCRRGGHEPHRRGERQRNVDRREPRRPLRQPARTARKRRQGPVQLLPRAGAGLPLREGGQRHRGAHRRLPAGEGHAATGRRAYPHAQGQGIRPGRAAEGAVPLGNAVRPGDGRTESRRRRGGLLRPDGPLPAGTDAHAARAGGHHVGNPGRHGIHARTPPRSRTAARGRGYRRRARRSAGFRHRKGRRPPRVRRVQHLHPTLLRPALAGPLHQRGIRR